MIGMSTAYVQAVMTAGGVPLLIPPNLDVDELMSILDLVDGLLIPGGGDVDPEYYGASPRTELRGVDRARDETEIQLVRAAVSRQKPLLAICRGHQVLNVALGGTLWQDVNSELPGGLLHDNFSRFPRNHIAHVVELDPASRLARCLDREKVPVNSMHHQAIRDLAPELAVVGKSEDGVIEAVEVPGHPFAVGVQWHPEHLIQDHPVMLALFRGLVGKACNGRSPDPQRENTAGAR